MIHATTHPFTAEELMAFCDGELSAEESRAVESHLAECQECADNVRQFRENSQSLGKWNAPPVPKRIDEAVEEELQSADSGRGRLRKAARSGSTRRPRWRSWAIAGVGAVATMLLIVAIGVFVAHYSVSNTASEKSQAALPKATLLTYLDTGRPGGAQRGIYAENRYQQPARASREETMGELSAPSKIPASPPPSDARSGTALSAPLIARSVGYLIVAKDIPAVRSSLDAILVRNHGYAAEMTVYTPSDDAPSLRASLRIPAANLAAAIGDLRGLGQVANESESGEDVTQQHADLDQRLKTARDTEERFRAILKQRTGTVNDVLQVEEEIARVRGDIESMEAEQANLVHRVDFVSIDLSVTQELSSVSGSTPLALRARNAFVAGYRNAAGTIVGIFLFLVAYGLTILIWIAILGLPVYLLRRRYRKMHARL